MYQNGSYTNQIEFTLLEFYSRMDTFTGKIYAGREDYSGNLVESQSLSAVNLPPSYGYDDMTKVVEFETAIFGDQLVAYYKEDTKSTFYPFRYEPLVVGFTAIPFFPAAAIKKKPSYVVGDLFVFELKNHLYDYSASTWTVTTPEGVTSSYSMTSDAVLLSEVGDYKITCTTDEETVVTYLTVTAAP